MRGVHRVGFADDCMAPMEASPMGMMFALEEESLVNPVQVPFEESAAAACDALQTLEHLLEPMSGPAEMLARHVELAVGGAHRVDPASLCAILQRLGYSAKLHESTAPLMAHSGKLRVQHQYITVCLPNTSATGLSTFIVEPNFRDSFCIAHPTPRYAAVLGGLPSAAVADRGCFHRAVSLLAREMALSFAHRGEDLPPWRSSQALLSRWHLGGAPGSLPSGPGSTSAWAQGRDLFAAKQPGGAYGAD